jgi:PAS domain S-box-containing protein
MTPTVPDTNGGIDEITVLHVDDEPDLADLTATFLSREDDRIDVQIATRTDAGLEILAEHDVDCVVSDYDMPGRNGIEFLEQVREKYPDLPFILYTGKGSEEVASDAISAGVTDYLQKEGGTSHYTVLANRIRNAVEKYHAQTELADREKRLNLFFEQSPLGVVEWDEEFNFVRLNDAAERILGYSEEALAGRSWDVIVPESDREPVDAVVSDLLENSGGYRSVNENVRPDGERIVCEWHNRVVTDESGAVVAIFSQFQDITERKERERDLQRYEAYLEESSDVITVLDDDGTVTYQSPAVERILGYEQDELIGQSGFDFIHPDDVDEVRETFTALTDEPGKTVTVEARFRTVDGEWRWLEICGTNRLEHDAINGIVTNNRDITERKERQRELEQTNTVLSTLFETLPVGVLAEDADRNVVAINDRMFDLFEFPSSVEEIQGADCEQLAERVSDLFVDPERFVERINDLVADRQPTSNEELALRDGRIFERDYRPIGFPEGKGHLWVYKDITEQKEQRRRYEAIFNQTYQFTGLLEPDGTVIEANDAALEFGGLDREEVIGQKMWEVYWFQHSEETRERAQTAVERAADGEFVRHELPVQGADRETIIDFSVRPITDEQGTVILLVPEGRDITDLKEREQALQRERDRLDEFASVVSHDLRNPLNVAKGRLELAREECDSEHLDPIGTAIDRIDRITEDVLWLAREGRDIGSTDPVVLCDTIDAAWEIAADHTEDAELRYAGEELSAITLEADKDRFTQLLENLFSNAIKHGGDDVTVTVGAVADGFYVEDDGPGIPEDRRDEVFTAGYSTGEEGTGFGLRIVERIVEAHDWKLDLTAGSEGGARFEITGVEFAE